GRDETYADTQVIRQDTCKQEFGCHFLQEYYLVSPRIMATKNLKAVVVGATGAVGGEILGQLLVNPAWGEVVVVGRREAPVPPEYKGWDPAKLQHKVIDMDNLASEASSAFEGADTVFCALGTTRATAGSAEAFQKVDLEYVRAAAEAAKQAKVSHFSLISAQGANPRMWASNLSLAHSLLYIKTKGLAEEAVKSQGFAYTTILRPGLLARGDKARTAERAFSFLLKGVPAMRFDGPAPERINGRLAMLAVITGVLEELRSGHGIIWQAQHPNPLIAVSFLAIIYASLVPILKGAVYEDFGIFTVVAEKLNGRAAMIGFASLLALEVVRQGALFGSI
ncbi:hypothetical protein APUTEX25_002073, partial [Auxenochlorella protothecoides]